MELIASRVIAMAMNHEARTGKRAKIVMKTEYYIEMIEEANKLEKVDIEKDLESAGYSAPLSGVDLHIDDRIEENFIIVDLNEDSEHEQGKKAKVITEGLFVHCHQYSIGDTISFSHIEPDGDGGVFYVFLRDSDEMEQALEPSDFEWL